MNGIFSIGFFLLGACIGSFLNVVAIRYKLGTNMTTERSRCMSCARQLTWYENIPVVSFVVLRARCRTCRTPLSWQYPLVELITALVWWGVWYYVMPTGYGMAPLNVYVWPLMLTIVYGTLMSALVLIAVYDRWHTIIPNAFVYPFIGISGVALVVTHWPWLYTAAFYYDLAAGPLLFAPFYIVWRISYGQWIGLGDGKVAWGIGWMLGLAHGVSAIILSFWIGAIVSVALLGVGWLQRRYTHVTWIHHLPSLTRKSQVPFGPFLVAGVVVEMFMRFDVLNIALLF